MWAAERRIVPRYFFHLLDDVDAPDREGKELLNLAEAHECAVRHVLFTMADTLKVEAKLVRSHRIQIEDADGNVLDTVYFGDVVTIEEERRITDTLGREPKVSRPFF